MIKGTDLLCSEREQDRNKDGVKKREVKRMVMVELKEIKNVNSCDCLFSLFH